MRYYSELNCQDCFTIPCACVVDLSMPLPDLIKREVKLKTEQIKNLEHEIAELLLKLEEIQE